MGRRSLAAPTKLLLADTRRAAMKNFMLILWIGLVIGLWIRKVIGLMDTSFFFLEFCPLCDNNRLNSLLNEAKLLYDHYCITQ